MNLATKKRLVKGCILALALWPLAHVYVVRSTGMSPWRGFGWGMYTVPVMKVDVAVAPLAGHAGTPAEDAQQTLAAEIGRYIKRYQALGSRCRPDAVAATVFAAYPGLDQIEIKVRQHQLDRKTATIVDGRSDRFPYRRE